LCMHMKFYREIEKKTKVSSLNLMFYFSWNALLTLLMTKICAING
jgi:hypothetical protein